jgi:hypothetical protein
MSSSSISDFIGPPFSYFSVGVCIRIHVSFKVTIQSTQSTVKGALMDHLKTSKIAVELRAVVD